MQNDLINKLKKTTIFRKTIDYSGKPVRFFKSLKYSPKDYHITPPILVNSLPKSGTHLLTQIVEVLPRTKSYGTFITSTPSLPHKLQDDNKIAKKLKKLIPTELARAHIYYKKEYETVIQQQNIAMYFIYRDPRDVLVSEMNFLTYQFRWHSMHKYFKKLKNDKERLILCIKGVSDSKFPYYYPDISKRFGNYFGWVNSSALAIRYEDLISNNKEFYIKQIVNFYFNKVKNKKENIDEEYYCKLALSNINPKKSHTFSKGKKGRWKEYFDDEIKSLFKKYGNDLLIRYGYEENENW